MDVAFEQFEKMAPCGEGEMNCSDARSTEFWNRPKPWASAEARLHEGLRDGESAGDAWSLSITLMQPHPLEPREAGLALGGVEDWLASLQTS